MIPVSERFLAAILQGHEPDRWVVLGDESIQRIVDHSWADERDVSYGWTKVARPDGALLE